MDLQFYRVMIAILSVSCAGWAPQALAAGENACSQPSIQPVIPNQAAIEKAVAAADASGNDLVNNLPGCKPGLLPQSVSDYCARELGLDSMEYCNEKNNLGFALTDDEMQAPYVSQMYARLQKGFYDLSVFPCEKCEKPNAQKTTEIIRALIHRQRVVEIPGYANVTEFIQANTAIVRKTLEAEADVFAEAMFAEESGSDFDQRAKDSTRAREKVKKDWLTQWNSEKVRVAVETDWVPFEVVSPQGELLPSHPTVLIHGTNSTAKYIGKSPVTGNEEELKFAGDGVTMWGVTMLNKTPFTSKSFGQFKLIPISTPLKDHLYWEGDSLGKLSDRYCAQPDLFKLKDATRLESIWGSRDESMGRKALLFVPRLVTGLIRPIVLGRTAHSIINLPRAGKDLAKLDGRSVNYDLADSPLNPFLTAHDVLLDASTMIKSPYYATSRMSTRIQLCTTPIAARRGSGMVWTSAVFPALHVGVRLDGIDGLDNEDQIMGDIRANPSSVSCQTVPLLNNEPESIVMQRLKCLFSQERLPYYFWRFNCGALAKVLLESAGSAMPSLPNIGIGNELGMWPLTRDEWKAVDRAKMTCDLQIRGLRNIFSEMESGAPVDWKYYGDVIAATSGYTPDVALQLMVSAARAKITDEQSANDRNAIFDIGGNYGVGQEVYIEHRAPPAGDRIKPQLRSTLDQIFGTLDDGAIQYLKDRASPNILEIYYLLHPERKKIP